VRQDDQPRICPVAESTLRRTDRPERLSASIQYCEPSSSTPPKLVIVVTFEALQDQPEGQRSAAHRGRRWRC
jgi:hypothetical protein